jgi:hypothetical protein
VAFSGRQLGSLYQVSNLTMREHSPEPWSVRVLEEESVVEILDANHALILQLSSPEGLEYLLIHAARMMVCVNMCAGTSTEDLEYIVRGREWQRKRDKLA